MEVTVISIKRYPRFEGNEIILPGPDGNEVRLPLENSNTEEIWWGVRPEGSWIQFDLDACAFAASLLYSIQKGIPFYAPVYYTAQEGIVPRVGSQEWRQNSEAADRWRLQIGGAIARAPRGDRWAAFFKGIYAAALRPREAA